MTGAVVESELVSRTRVAALQVAAAWAKDRRLDGKPRLALSFARLDEPSDKNRHALSLAELHGELKPEGRFTLEGPPGCGKTATLIQLAEYRGGPVLPILVDLPAWIDSGADLLEFLACRQPFRAAGIDTASLSRVLHSTHVAFLLNGWNEIAEAHTARADIRLRNLVQDFPEACLVIATRLRTPLGGARRLRVLRLSARERMRYLNGCLKPQVAKDLESKLRCDPVLKELSGTPFILTAMVRIAESGSAIPHTKIGLLRSVAQLIEQENAHCQALQAPPLEGRASEYLRGVAVELTARAAVLCSEEAARATCAEVGDRLRAARKIDGEPGAGSILKVLACHHLLERVDDSELRYRFAHQQYQEFYAAEALFEELCAAAAGDAAQRESLICNRLNLPAWDEPLKMIAQYLGATPEFSAQGEFLVKAALEVDLVLAAHLARLCCVSFKKPVGKELVARIRDLWNLHEFENHRCALIAMLATGSDEFADILVPKLTGSDDGVGGAIGYRGVQLHKSSLGPNWRQVVAMWPPSRRSDFVTTLGLQYGDLEAALSFARTDPDLEVRLEALVALTWHGEQDAATEILEELPDDELVAAIEKLEPEFCPTALRLRAIELYESLLREAASPQRKFEIAEALSKLGSPNAAISLRAALEACSRDNVTPSHDAALEEAVSVIRRQDPEWADEWIATNVASGALNSYWWAEHVSRVPDAIARRLMREASTAQLHPGSIASFTELFKRVSSPQVAGESFRALVKCRARASQQQRAEVQEQLNRQLTCLFRALPLAVAVDGLASLWKKAPRCKELTVVLELFRDMEGERRDVKGALDDHAQQALRRYLNAGVAVAIADENLGNEQRARLALAIAETGVPEDVESLLTLIRAHVEGIKRSWIGQRDGKRVSNPAGWTHSYVRSLVRLGGRAAETALIDLLQAPDYTLAAACALRVLALREPDESLVHEGVHFRHNYREWALRKSRSREPEWDRSRRRRYAAAVGTRLKGLRSELLNHGTELRPVLWEAKQLALVLADLDPIGSRDCLLGLAALPARSDVYTRVALVESLACEGSALPLDRVFAVFDDVIDGQRASLRKGHCDREALQRLLRVLPMVDDPVGGIVRIRALQEEFKLELHQDAALLMTLARCGVEEGVAYLRDIALSESHLFKNFAKSWFSAVASSPLSSARELLLAFVDPQADFGIGTTELDRYATGLLAAHLAEIANHDDTIRERIWALCANAPAGAQRDRLAATVTAMQSEAALCAGLDLIDDGLPQPVPNELWQGIMQMHVDHRQTDGGPDHIRHPQPRALNSIRKKLAEMTTSDPRRARSATELLDAIELWRVEGGRPPLELRDPACQFGLLGPLLAGSGEVARVPQTAAGTSNVLGRPDSSHGQAPSENLQEQRPVLVSSHVNEQGPAQSDPHLRHLGAVLKKKCISIETWAKDHRFGRTTVFDWRRCRKTGASAYGRVSSAKCAEIEQAIEIDASALGLRARTDSD